MAKKSAANDPGVIDDARRKIGAAALELLNDRPLAALDLADIGVAAKVEGGLVRRLFPHPARQWKRGSPILMKASCCLWLMILPMTRGFTP